MYVFGIDIPLIELIIAMGVIGMILLLEITVLLVLISYHMKNSRRLEGQVGKLLHALTKLNKEELKELESIKNIEDKEEGIISRLRKIKTVKQYAKKKPSAGNLGKKERKKLYEEMSKSRTRSKIIKTVDKFLKRWKK